MARQVVSYDDITSTPPPSAPSAGVANTSVSQVMETRPTPPDISAHPRPTRTNAPGEPQSNEAPLKKRKMDGSGGHVNIGAMGPPSTIPFHHSSPAGSTQNISRNNKKKGKRKNRHAASEGGFAGGGAVIATNGSGTWSGAAAHWDDPGLENNIIAYEDADLSGAYGGEESREEVEMELEGAYEYADDEEEEGDESRELTHDEIWDDSALIDAWNAATEEYEGMHGRNKNWKKERVHNSPLWYNIPPDRSKGKSRSKPVPRTNTVPAPLADQEEETTAPYDFNTFVPQHDASLASVVPDEPPEVPAFTRQTVSNSASYYESMITGPGIGGSNVGAGATVSADEAFTQALGAMYWAGYWTAVYHTRKIGASEPVLAEHEQTAEEEEEEEEDRLDHELELTEALISTQR